MSTASRPEDNSQDKAPLRSNQSVGVHLVGWCPSLNFVSAFPRRSLRLGGGNVNITLNRRDAEDAESETRSLLLVSTSSALLVSPYSLLTQTTSPVLISNSPLPNCRLPLFNVQNALPKLVLDPLPAVSNCGVGPAKTKTQRLRLQRQEAEMGSGTKSNFRGH